MIEALGIYTLIVAAIFVASVFTGYYIYEDFTGIIIGLAGATAITYFLRKLVLGLAATNII